MENDLLKLEYRMYGLVAYQLSGTIHAGIQFGHAVVEYQQNVKYLTPYEKIYDKWAQKDKTFIILNGGTTNNNPEKLGTLNTHLNTLVENGVLTSEFYEPDLGDQLTAIVFLVDERVWNRELYKDFEDVMEDNFYTTNEDYKEWVDNIGGEKNVFLREFLKTFRLA